MTFIIDKKIKLLKDYKFDYRIGKRNFKRGRQ